VKKLAVQYGQVTEDQVGDLPVEIYGGSKDERQAAYNALKADLTKGGSVAREISENLLANQTDGAVKPLEIVLTASYHSYSDPSANLIVIDTKNDLGATYASRVPGCKYTYDRIIAHELGHVGLFLPDETESPAFMMTTVNRAENQIMNSVHGWGRTSAYDRIDY